MGAFKKYDGSVWQSINPKQLKGIPYTGTLPATLTGTKAGYLHKYKIYGNLEQTGTPTPSDPIYPSECGERTENKFDKDATLDGYWLSSATGVAVSQAGYSVSDYIRISDGESYTLVEAGKTFCWYDENKGFISTTKSATTASAPMGAAYFRANLYTANKGIAMIVEGSTAPTSYIPYGYKLPLLSGSTPVDIYIGDDTLSTEEYVDSGTGKIYRMVDSVLTPVDPPVPFPQIPTTANSTTISWAGQGLAPSEFDSIQEWVDIPTYKRVNGEWVEDN